VASNFARWFISVLGRECHIFVNSALLEAQNWTNRRARGARCDVTVIYGHYRSPSCGT